MLEIFDNYLYIEINRSVSLAIVLSFMHLGAALAVALSGVNATIAALAGVPIVLSLFSSLRMHAKRSSPGAVIGLRFDPSSDGDCQVLCRSSADVITCQTRTLFVSRLGIVATLACQDQRVWRAVVVMPDAVTKEVFRQLRVRLRLARPAA